MGKDWLEMKTDLDYNIISESEKTMSKKIVIKKCKNCPHVDHKGGFGHIAYIPVCRLADKELPYRVERGYGTMIIAKQTGGIPTWCPLEDN